MPLYIYSCRNCGKDSEYLLPMGEKPLACANCGAESQLERSLHGQTFSAHTTKKTQTSYFVPTWPIIIQEGVPCPLPICDKLGTLITIPLKEIFPTRDN